MISLLQRIVDMFVCWVQTGAVMAANWIIAGLGAIIEAAIELLPDMPDLPERPEWITLGFTWVGYWFPVGYLLEVMAAVFLLWVAWFVVRIPLRWAKANPS